MQSDNALAQIRKIEATFRQIQDNFSESVSNEQLYNLLELQDIEFRSVAYEAASMCLALFDLKRQLPLERWRAFFDGYAKPHAVQYHIGLGWAVAQLQLPLQQFIDGSNSAYRYRIADGYGYYEGMFRRRKTIDNKELSDWEDVLTLENYYQGLGRSIWYVFNANCSKVAEVIAAFPLHLQPHLWRGIGIAVSYTGGCEHAGLLQLLSGAGSSAEELRKGAQLAIESRRMSGTITSATETPLRVWS